MVDAKDQLCAHGYDGWIHPHYEELVAGKRKEQLEQWEGGERAAIKRHYDYLREHYQHILQSDAVLIVNLEKHGIQNYIGGNVLIEMGQAFVNDKKIFFLNAMPEKLPYLDEIEAMDPVCLEGDLTRIG